MNNQNNYPRIGIRPIIDGRLGGVRESLEETTMKMAVNVAALYEKQLKYPDGSPVQCVIADSCIGGIREAAVCAEKYESSIAKSDLGFQWYRKTWCRIPCRNPCSA